MNKPQRRQSGFILLLAGVIFLSAFLLFQVQPLIGRFLLPWFGGSPEVWTTCMLFFQAFLLAGYAYAHFLLRLKNRRWQALIHVCLLAISIIFLPIFPQDSFKPLPSDNPILKILLICSATIGLPYLILSATSPLIQVWFARSMPDRNPYRLYALSNAGSLLALASFPFVFEPMLTRSQTVYVWSGLFAVFAILCAAATLLSSRRGLQPVEAAITKVSADFKDRKTRLLWLALPAAASIELLSVTNKITQDIAVIPFLWVLPLGLYLLSFIICFEHQKWYKRPVWVTSFIVGIVGVIYAHVNEKDISDVKILIALYVFMLFSCCMVCHGELYRLKPGAAHLTWYYLLISVGGAFGGFFVAVLAPLIFDVYIELWIGLLTTALFLFIIENSERSKKNRNAKVDTRRKWLLAAMAIVILVGILFAGKENGYHQRAIENRRNFFGVLTVWEDSWDDPDMHILLLQHGTTYHGLQFQSPAKKRLPTTYYSPDSGIGIVMQNFRAERPRRIGIVGLGVGTLAAYGRPGDIMRFYEINNDVQKLARQYFTYLEDTKANVEVVLGDARLTMENETPQAYDILVLDAFSSDAVPVHLLTKEALEVYLKHLDKGGILAFHISTMFLDLQSVVWRLADEYKLNTAWVEGAENGLTGSLASDWILLSKDQTFLNSEVIKNASSPSFGTRKDVMLWTDDHINLLQILEKSQ